MKLNFTKDIIEAMLSNKMHPPSIFNVYRDWLTLYAEVGRLNTIITSGASQYCAAMTAKLEGQITYLKKELDDAYEFKRHNPLEQEVYELHGRLEAKVAEIKRLRAALSNITPACNCADIRPHKRPCDGCIGAKALAASGAPEKEEGK